MSTFSKVATPLASVTAYSSTGRPESEVPDRRNLTLSARPSSAVLVTVRLPRFNVLLKLTVAVLPLTTITLRASCGSYWS